MGESVENKTFTFGDDGTIVRERICPVCGKETYSGGDFCEHCGHKLNYYKGKDYDKKPAFWEWLVLVVGTIFFGFAGAWMGYRFNSVVDTNGLIQYRYGQNTRKAGSVAMVISVLSAFIWGLLLNS